MSRLTSLTIALATAVFLSVPHLAMAVGDDQRARARTQGRTASAPAQTSRSGSRRAPATRSNRRKARSAPAQRAPSPQARPGARTTQLGSQGARRQPGVRGGERVSKGVLITRPEAEAPTRTSRPLSRRAPIVRNGGRGATVDAKTRQEAPASNGITRTTRGKVANASAPNRRVVGVASATAAKTGHTAGTAVRRRPERIVEVDGIDGTHQSESTRGSAIRVGTSTRTRSDVRKPAVTQVGSIIHTATARPNRRPAGPGNVVGKAVPRATIGGTFSGNAGSRSQGYISRRGTTSSYGHRYPYDGGRIRFGRSTGYYGRGHYYASSSYRPRRYGSSYYPRYGVSLGINFGSGSAFGHYGHGGYQAYGYYRYGHPYYPLHYTTYGYGQSYVDPYMGSLRLKVKPRDAEVFVDGYYVGLVDHFDGFAQRLRLEEGTYQIEIRHPAYLPINLDVLITAGETVAFEKNMIRQ